MDDLQRGIYRMVVKEVERTQPKREENFLSKKDAEKLIKKYTKRYVLQEYLNATEAADVLDMSLTTFWRYRQKHPVPVYVIDGVKRYKKSELIKCVKDNSVRGYAQEDIMPDLGNTKLDHVLSYICDAIEGACVLGVSVAFIYWFIYWINQLVSNWIYRAFFQEVKHEIMEEFYQPRLASRRANKYERRCQNLVSCSNALYFGGSAFGELPTSVKSFLGIKKALNCQDS